MAITTARHPQSPGEEIANSVSHGFGFLALLVATPVLLGDAVARTDRLSVAAAGVFAVAAGFTYVVSAIYHALGAGPAKQTFRVLDHSAIFVLIAGTYTPFTLGVLRGSWGWSLLALVWSLAIVGVVREIRGAGSRAFSIALYLAMGWVIVIAAKPLWLAMPRAGLAWLVAGGAAYTVGVVFYAAGRFRFSHLVWHLFVMAGTACHFVAVLRYAA